MRPHTLFRLSAFVFAAALFLALPVFSQSSRDLTVGEFHVRALRDAQFYLPTSLLAGITHEEAAKLAGGDSMQTPANAYLVRTGKRVILVDAGMGKYPGEDSGHLIEHLKEAGVEPAQVELILITHFHFDHIGGLTSPDGKRVFPNAIVRASKTESDFWLGDTAAMPKALRGRAARIQSILAPYTSAKSFRPFLPGEELGDGVRAFSAVGHTPGHAVYAFTSNGQELWCIGDLIHFSLQFLHPSVGVVFDSEGKQAIASRLELFKKAAAGHIILAGAHLPNIVTLTAKGEGYEANAMEGK